MRTAQPRPSHADREVREHAVPSGRLGDGAENGNIGDLDAVPRSEQQSSSLATSDLDAVSATLEATEASHKAEQRRRASRFHPSMISIGDKVDDKVQGMSQV